MAILAKAVKGVAVIRVVLKAHNVTLWVGSVNVDLELGVSPAVNVKMVTMTILELDVKVSLSCSFMDKFVNALATLKEYNGNTCSVNTVSYLH